MTLNLGCPVLYEGDEGYEVARRVWNGMIDRRPRWIVRPQSIADVMLSVCFARDSGLPICVCGARDFLSSGPGRGAALGTHDLCFLLVFG
jgi:hypothetical protein